MRSAHVEAQHHLPLKPGTNVAVVTSLSHVIVTEGLFDEKFIRERCDWSEFEDWAAFVAEPQHSPEEVEKLSGVPAEEIRGAARLFAKGGNGAIYYGLGVTEHSQGSTTVMAIANLAMLTGNIGRPGVGVNPLRGQNNVQGACDMGSFPHELPGYRHMSDDATRDIYESLWGVTLDPEPGLRIPNMLDAARRRLVQGHLHPGRGHRAVRSQHASRRGRPRGDGMRRRARPVPQRDRQLRPCLPAGLDLPGEGRDLHQCRAPHQPGAQGDGAEERPRRLGSHPETCADDGACPGATSIRPRSWTRSPRRRRASPSSRYDLLDREGSVQWPCNEKAPLGTPVMHIGGFVRGKGKFIRTEYVATDEKTGPRFPLLLTTGRILSQYNVGAQTRRTENVVWHQEDRLEIHPHDAEQRGIHDEDWVRIQSRAGETTLRALITERVAPGVVYTTFHHPNTQANVITTDFSDWATNCPEYKVTAVQVAPSNGPSDWQTEYNAQARRSRRIEGRLEAAE